MRVPEFGDNRRFRSYSSGNDAQPALPVLNFVSRYPVRPRLRAPESVDSFPEFDRPARLDLLASATGADLVFSRTTLARRRFRTATGAMNYRHTVSYLIDPVIFPFQSGRMRAVFAGCISTAPSVIRNERNSVTISSRLPMGPRPPDRAPVRGLGTGRPGFARQPAKGRSLMKFKKLALMSSATALAACMSAPAWAQGDQAPPAPKATARTAATAPPTSSSPPNSARPISRTRRSRSPRSTPSCSRRAARPTSSRSPARRPTCSSSRRTRSTATA